MRTCSRLAVLVCLVVAAHSWAEAPTEKAGPERSVASLISQLGSDQHEQRALASQLLRDRGPDILPALRAALEDSDPEVRRRLSDLVTELETSANLASKHVSLHIEKQPLQQVFAELMRQSGYKVEFWANNDQQPYTFDFDRLTFWEALDRISNTAGLVLQPGYGDTVLHLQGQDSYVPFVSYDGPFRIVASGLHQNRSIDFAAVPRNLPSNRHSENLNFTFTVFAEPRIPLLGVGEPHLEAAYDNEQNSMLPQGSPNGTMTHMVARFGNGARSLAQQTQVNLVRASEKATSIKLIRGNLPVTLLLHEKPEMVTSKLLQSKGQKTKAGGAGFVIEDVSETPNKQYQVKLSITDENNEASNDYTWVNSLYYRLEVQDDDGNKYQIMGSSWGQSNPKHVEITFTYGQPGNVKVGPPTRLIYRTWDTLTTQVNFTFKDLPLP